MNKNYLDNTIIIAQQQIRLPLNCPKCNTWYSATITKVKNKCPKCGEEFEKDLEIETEKTHSVEILKTVCFIALKEFQTNSEITILSKDRYMQSVEQLANLFKPFGIIIKERDITTVPDESKGKKITVNRIILAKDEKVHYWS